MATDTEVKVNAPGSGPAISLLGINRLNDVDASGNAGTVETVHEQVIATGDKHGDLIEDQSGLILSELRKITEQLLLLNMKLS